VAIRLDLQNTNNVVFALDRSVQNPQQFFEVSLRIAAIGIFQSRQPASR
jgi:hypothetical protein